MYAVNCLYDDNKNTLFVVADNNRPEYRRLGATVKDGYNDMEGDLNILKFFRTTMKTSSCMKTVQTATLRTVTLA